VSVYCTEGEIAGYLPSNYANVITDFTTIIANASAFVDGALCAKYWPFNSVTDTPSTPQIIRAVTSRYAAWLSLLTLKSVNRASDTSPAETYRLSAIQDLMAIADGTHQIPKEAVASETMTSLGTAPLESDEYKFAVAPKTVEPGSVVITGYQNGIDFVVGYSAINRGSILTRLNDAITTATTVAYEFSYLRQTEVETPAGQSGGRLIRA